MCEECGGVGWWEECWSCGQVDCECGYYDYGPENCSWCNGDGWLDPGDWRLRKINLQGCQCRTKKFNIQ